MYQVLFQFQSLEDLVNWNKQFGKLVNKKPVTIEQNKNDKPDNRGSKTKEMHTRAKEYHQANPTLTYRECFVKVSKNQV
jgi:hypothetical protein